MRQPRVASSPLPQQAQLRFTPTLVAVGPIPALGAAVPAAAPCERLASAPPEVADDYGARVAPGALARVVPAAAIAAIGGGLALEAGGYFPRAWVWSGVVLLWVAALAGAFRTPLELDRRAALFAGAVALLAAWTLLSVTWSVERRETLLEARRDVVYLGVVAAAVFACSRLAARQLPGAVLAASTLIACLGVGRYLASGPVDPYQGGLLSWPIGYANAFAALAAIAIPLALGLAAHGRVAEVRAASAAALALLVAVPLLSSSTGGVLATLAGLGTVVVLDPRRRVLVGTALRLALPAAAVVAVGLWTDLPHATLTGSGTGARRAALAATVLAAAALAAFLGRESRPARRPRALPRPLALGIASLSVLLGALVAALPELGGERLLRTLVGVERAGYWQIAWHVVRVHPLLGSGGGTFGRAWFFLGPPALAGALDAHGLYVETLAELGPVGLGLLVLALSVPIISARAAARASRLGACAAAGYVAFLVHAFVDWDWEMPAVTVPALALGASVVILAGRPSRTRTAGPRLRLACAAVAVVVAVVSLLGLRSDAIPAAAAAPRATAAHAA
jgi:hypothetical protein